MNDRELTLKAREIARHLTYNEEPHGSAKRVIDEMAHRIDSRNVWVSLTGRSVHNALGRFRDMTLLERVRWRLFGTIPPLGPTS